MPNPNNQPRVFFLTGPTAAGKGALAVRLARELPLELLICDAVKVCRGLELGSNKPSAELRRELPIHLVDLVEPSSRFSAGEYARLAAAKVREVTERGRLPLVVGGTLLFAKALFDGLCKAPATDPAVQAVLEEEPSERLYAELEQVDPAAARRIHRNDRQRVIRALAVFQQSGKPLSTWQEETTSPLADYQIKRIALIPPRQMLYRQINRRAERMFQRGLVDEVRGLLTSYSADCPALQTIGYRQVVLHLQEELTLGEAVEETARATRRLAKRQLTWLRGDDSFTILDPTEFSAEALFERFSGWIEE